MARDEGQPFATLPITLELRDLQSPLLAWGRLVASPFIVNEIDLLPALPVVVQCLCRINVAFFEGNLPTSPRICPLSFSDS